VIERSEQDVNNVLSFARKFGKIKEIKEFEQVLQMGSNATAPYLKVGCAFENGFAVVFLILEHCHPISPSFRA